MSDRFGLIFYDTSADSMLWPQIHTTALKCTQGLCNQKKFSNFYTKIYTVTFPLMLFINLVNLTQSENASESDSVDPRGGHKSQIQSVTEVEITNEY